MKRISIFIVLVLLLALTACSRDSAPTDATVSTGAVYQDQTTAPTETPTADPYATLSSTLTDCVFTDSEGEELTLQDSVCSGTFTQSDLKLETGEPAAFSLDIALCDRYEYVNRDAKDIDLAFTTSDGNAQISGSGIERVVFDRTACKLSIYGKNMSYRVWLCVDTTDRINFALFGNNETDFVIDVQDGAVVTSGLTGFQQFGFQTAELYDENLTEAEFPLAGPIAIPDVSEIVEANRKWEAEHYGES